MKGRLFLDLIGFALSRKSPLERLRYVCLGLIFYIFLAQSISMRSNGSNSAENSQAGDDIYPLF